MIGIALDKPSAWVIISSAGILTNRKARMVACQCEHISLPSMPSTHIIICFYCYRAVDPGHVKTTEVDHGRIWLSCVFCRKNIRLHAATLNQPTIMSSATCISCYLMVTFALNLLALQIAPGDLQRLFPEMHYDDDLYPPPSFPVTQPVRSLLPVRRTALHLSSPSLVCGKHRHASISHVPPHQVPPVQSCLSNAASLSNSFPPYSHTFLDDNLAYPYQHIAKGYQPYLSQDHLQ